MKLQTPMSRRDLIASVSMFAVVGAVTPKLMLGAPKAKDEFIVLNGWVLKRSETT